MREGTHWQALAELTWSSTSDIPPQWSRTGKTMPPWLDCIESAAKSWPIAQPVKDGEDERNGISDHCNFPSTKKAPSFCSPYSSLQIFLVNQKLKVPSCKFVICWDVIVSIICAFQIHQEIVRCLDGDNKRQNNLQFIQIQWKTKLWGNGDTVDQYAFYLRMESWKSQSQPTSKILTTFSCPLTVLLLSSFEVVNDISSLVISLFDSSMLTKDLNPKSSTLS